MPLSGQAALLRRFELVRALDHSGISGTGVVALGVQFPNGKCVMQWAPSLDGKDASLQQHDTIEGLERTHGHHGATVVRWLDEEPS